NFGEGLREVSPAALYRLLSNQSLTMRLGTSFRGEPLPEKSCRYASLRAKIFRPSLKGRVVRFAADAFVFHLGQRGIRIETGAI
ncbi:MAG: hypothetical protein ACLQUZ_08640, partial [Rhizomicrobium sp.]